MNKKQFIDNIISKIIMICDNEFIIKHVKRLLNDNFDYITEISDFYVAANRYGEKMEISIGSNSFTIFSTDWNTSDQKTIKVEKDDNEIKVFFENKDITMDGQTIVKSNYIFKDEKLSSAVYNKRSDYEFKIRNENREKHYEEQIEIYPLDNNLALKKVKYNKKVDYYLTNLNEVKLHDISLYGFVFSTMDGLISEDDYNEKKRLRMVKK